MPERVGIPLLGKATCSGMPERGWYPTLLPPTPPAPAGLHDSSAAHTWPHSPTTRAAVQPASALPVSLSSPPLAPTPIPLASDHCPARWLPGCDAHNSPTAFATSRLPP